MEMTKEQGSEMAQGSQAEQREHAVKNESVAWERLRAENRRETHLYRDTMILDINQINTKSPYKVRAVPDSNFVSFITDYGVQYAAGFEKDNITMPFTETYQFSILNGNNKKSPRDSKVRDTIVSIIENFFVLNNEVVLYICETGDGKQSMRNRLFEYWFKHYKKNWNIMFLSSSVRDEEGMINYAGIILRNDNPRLKQIVNEFTDTVTLLNDKPTR